MDMSDTLYSVIISSSKYDIVHVDPYVDNLAPEVFMQGSEVDCVKIQVSIQCRTCPSPVSSLNE
jgi:hypothetical protein